jgi:hypothetical protein
MKAGSTGRMALLFWRQRDPREQDRRMLKRHGIGNHSRIFGVG